MSRTRALAGDTLRSLRVPSFRRYFVGMSIGQIGTWMTMIASVLVVHDRTERALAVGALTACQFVPTLVLGAWAGVVTDRADKRLLMIRIQLVALGQTSLLATFTLAGSGSLAPYFALAVVGGVAAAFESPARRTFIAEMVDGADMANAVALNSAMMYLARIVGPALAGLVVVAWGPGWAFVAATLASLVLFDRLRRIDPAELRRTPLVVRARGQVLEAVRYLREERDLWVLMVMLTIIGVCTYNFPVTFPDLVRDRLGGGPSSFPLLFSCTSLGSLVGALAIAGRRDLRTSDVPVTALAFGLAMAVLGLAPNLRLAYAAGFIVGLASVAFLTTTTTLVQLRCAPGMQGRVLALQGLVIVGTTPIGGPILGYLIDHTDARVGVLVGAGGAVAAAALGLALLRSQPLLCSNPSLVAEELG